MVEAMLSQETRFSKRDTHTHSRTHSYYGYAFKSSPLGRAGEDRFRLLCSCDKRKGDPSMIFGQSIHPRRDCLTEMMAGQPRCLGSPPWPVLCRPAINQVQLSPPVGVPLSLYYGRLCQCCLGPRHRRLGVWPVGEPVIRPCYPSIGRIAGASQPGAHRSTRASAIKADCVPILGFVG